MHGKTLIIKKFIKSIDDAQTDEVVTVSTSHRLNNVGMFRIRILHIWFIADDQTSMLQKPEQKLFTKRLNLQHNYSQNIAVSA